MIATLDIDRWDLECDFNNTDHYTDLNGVDRLIVRRGQPFNISLYLRSGSYQPGLSSLECIAETGPQPSEQYGTRASFGLSANIDTSRWSAAVVSPPGDTVALSLCAAPDAPIGRYILTMGRSARIEFILLFNPWCSGDAVYLDNKESLEEYVLSQDGIIFQGDVNHPIATPWNFGQFESGILDVCLRILDMNPKCLRNPGKDCSGRRNPIYVSRVVSAMVNCNDDKGVLLGNWTNDFDGGVSPMFWKGSVEILRNWQTQACQPVRFGQCWVFAAVACSISRALGIPCRVVTNYYSAHDVNRNLTIERYVNENGELVRSKEMIWNYHCWVESWMTRPDLTGSAYNGWQASDPTPQEKSDGVFCCGPIPVRAIKEGELMYKYDAPFVFAEVNADVITTMMKKDGSTSKVTSTQLVGKKISTKGIGSDYREDITHLYKHPEGSDEEREAFKKANHQNKLLQTKESEGLNVSIKVSPEMKKGCDFEVFAVVTNNSSSDKKCRLLFGSCAVSYNGFQGGNCGFKDLLNVELSPGGARKVPLRLNYSKYGGLLTEDNMIRLAALLFDYATREATLAVRNIVLDNPEIQVRILGEPKENRKLAAEITLKNPLPEPLENCCFSMEGANLTGGRVISERLRSAVGPGEDAKVKMYFTPTHSGLRKLVVDFDSSKLCHVKGYKNVIIGK
ncbi:protein-glutamine gamma-glutamyltransferase 2 isoform X2 [Hippocampus comes]|uniref:protein-glutamine gamma-glutamyltransferase 2 isoform X2 n=1 Tax=Hippocampus comes TaxID=109280 RepID=UPI00094EF62A|nr:PREDICTED: protein-glutamine gamma-glutamyltransferase 2-like isoform X2 [Hippocampus comes]